MSLWAVSVIVSISSFLYGYCISNLNAALTANKPGSLLSDISLSTSQQEWATSATIIGGWVGCSVIGGVVEKFGLRPVLLWNNVLFVTGGIVSVFSSDVALYIGRFLCGLGVGVEGVVVPILLAEMSPAAMRGQITTLHQLMITLGILFSSLIGYVFVEYVSHGWKYIQGFTAVPAVIQVVLAFKVPESPRWLVRQSQSRSDAAYIDKARTTLQDLRGDSDVVEQELLEMRHELESEKESSNVSWSEVWALKRVLWIGLLLMFFNPMTGINAVIFYSTKIFEFAGFQQDILATVSVTTTNVIMTLISFFLVDRVGRKVLLSTGTLLMWLALIVQGVILLALNSQEHVQGIIAVTGALVFICGYAIGMGAVSWVLMNEILPARVRPKAFSLFVAESWLWNVIISLTTLTVIEALGGGSSDSEEKKGVAILFLIFGVLAVLAWAFILVLVPETKGQGAAVQGPSAHTDDDVHGTTRLVVPKVSAFDRRSTLNTEQQASLINASA